MESLRKQVQRPMMNWMGCSIWSTSTIDNLRYDSSVVWWKLWMLSGKIPPLPHHPDSCTVPTDEPKTWMRLERLYRRKSVRIGHLSVSSMMTSTTFNLFSILWAFVRWSKLMLITFEGRNFSSLGVLPRHVTQWTLTPQIRVVCMRTSGWATPRFQNCEGLS